MFWFRGFKASVNFKSGKTSGVEHYDRSPGISLNGAYRTNRDELFGSDLYSETPKKITPSMVKLPTKHSGPPISQSKSTHNLTKPSNEATNIRKSAPDIPQAVNRPTTINVKEQKKLEKQRLAEQRKQEKLAEKEKQRDEKLRKEREKLIAQQSREAQQQRPKQEELMKPKKRTAPQPKQQILQSTPVISPQPKQQILQSTPVISPQPKQQILPSTPVISPQPKQQILQTTPSISPQRQQHPSNTLESSTSNCSGPPPYSSVPEVTPNQSDGTGNTSFAKPVEDTDSWDMISQHRQQMSRRAGIGKSAPRQKHLDLHYNGASENIEQPNSNA